MPGFTTHYLLGIKTYKDIPENKLKSIISKHQWLYLLGLQGPDMFFYNLPILRHRDYRNVGSYMHDSHVNEFFKNSFTYMDSLSNTTQKEQAISYIAGFMNHYIGDYICHPFVYGRIEHNIKSPSNYTHGLHAALENDIDAYLLMKYKKKKPSEFNQAATICLNSFEMQFISDFLYHTINETFYPITYNNNFQVTKPMIHRSILAMKYGCRTLADITGKKKQKIQKVEKIFLKKPIVSHKFVSDDFFYSYEQALNLNHEVWLNPWDKRLASQESFLDLIKKWYQKCEEVYYIFDKCIPIILSSDSTDFSTLLNSLGNYSYHSGLDVG